MKVLITGADGFIAKNLISHLDILDIDIIKCFRKTNIEKIISETNNIDFIFHLAGVNRPNKLSEFSEVNLGLTKNICDLLCKYNIKAPILFSSSTQATSNNEYGKSKLNAEKVLSDFSSSNSSSVYIFRLPNVFGKWSKPNYNSVVATFCFNTINGNVHKIDDKEKILHLAYIDDVVSEFIEILRNQPKGYHCFDFKKIFKTTLLDLSNTIQSFKLGRIKNQIASVGLGLERCLYATYLSFYKPDDFIHKLNPHNDARGIFAEVLKTFDSGQFSFFTIYPGKVRGDHYHHTKNEKFVVLSGSARFGFRNIITDELFEIKVSGKDYFIVDSIPGWTHNIKNIGNSDLVVMLWSNEIFDSENPDTIAYKV